MSKPSDDTPLFDVLVRHAVRKQAVLAVLLAGGVVFGFWLTSNVVSRALVVFSLGGLASAAAIGVVKTRAGTTRGIREAAALVGGRQRLSELSRMSDRTLLLQGPLRVSPTVSSKWAPLSVPVHVFPHLLAVEGHLPVEVRATRDFLRSTSVEHMASRPGYELLLVTLHFSLQRPLTMCLMPEQVKRLKAALAR